MIVILTEQDIVDAYTVAGERMAQNLYNRAKPRWGKTQELWCRHLTGTLAEIALAKALGRPWTGRRTGEYRNADVGNDMQSRGTFDPGGMLLLYDWDNDDHAFFLVIIDRMNANVFGGCRGHFGKKPQWRGYVGDGIECWKVPQHALTPYKPDVGEPYRYPEPDDEP